MTTVMSLDLGYTGTGLASWRDGQVSVTTIRTTRPEHDHNGWEWPRRQRRILAPILEVARRDPGRTVCVKERRIDSLDVSGSSALDLAGLHGVCEYALAALGVPIAQVNLTHLKLYASGKGNASKQWMRTQAVRELGRWVMVANDDEADALWLLAMALDHYGLQRGPGPGLNPVALTLSSPFRRSVLEKTRWPHWLTPQDLAATPTASRRTQVHTEQEVRS